MKCKGIADATDFAILAKDGEKMKLAVVTHTPQPSLIFLQPKEQVK